MKRAHPDAADAAETEPEANNGERGTPNNSGAAAEEAADTRQQQESAIVKQPSTTGSPAVAYANIPGFLTKTFEIFTNSSYSKLCSWGPAGDTIVIYKIPEFASEVLPQYFKHSNFQSFVRQLNMYDFHKTVQDPSHGEFQHQYFKKGRPDLLHLIKRKVGNSGANCNSSLNSGGKVTRAAQQQQQQQQQQSNGSALSSALTPSPLARAMAEAWPEHKEKIAAHTDTVITELVQLQHWAKHMEHRIVELEAQNRHLNTANDTLWKTLQKHSASQLQMQTKMQKIIYFLYHTVLTPEAKAQLEQLDADSGNMLMFKNSGQLGNGMGNQMRQNPQIGGQQQQQQQQLRGQAQLMNTAAGQQQQQQGGTGGGINMQSNLFAESLKYLNMEMPGAAPTPMPGMMPGQQQQQQQHNPMQALQYANGINNNNSSSSSSNAPAVGGSMTTNQAAMTQLMAHLNQLGGGTAQGSAMLMPQGGAMGGSLGGMVSPYAAPPPHMGGHPMGGMHPGLAATLSQQMGSMGGMPPMGNAMPNLGGYAGGTGGALTHNTHAALRQPYMSAQVLNAATAAAAQASGHNQGDLNMARAGLTGGASTAATAGIGGGTANNPNSANSLGSIGAMDRHPAKRQRRGGSSDGGRGGGGNDDKDSDTAALVREDMEDLGMAEAETYNKLDSLESHLSSLFDGEEFENMLNVG